MANRKRPIILRCPVTAEERALIEQKMAQLKLSAIGRNINQIAKKLNAGGSVYQADIEEIRERQDQIWRLQRRILSSLR